MEAGFSQDEIKELVRIARVYAPGFSEERFRALVESLTRLGESRFPEAAWAVVRLERELGVPCDQVPDRYQALVKELPALEGAVASCQQALAGLRSQTLEENERLAKSRKAVAQSEREREQLEKELVALRERAQKEKARLAAGVEQAQEEARLSTEAVATALRLKGETERRGLSLGLVLALCQEIPDDEEARGRLAAAIQRQGSLGADITAREKKLGEVEEKLSQAEQELRGKQEALSQLRKDEANEATVHGFYLRFQGLGPLMEYLRGWENIAFRFCQMCGARFWAERKTPKGLVYFQRNYLVCPCCGHAAAVFDSQVHSILGWPAGDVVGRIVLGG